jgi:hypothetical protein
MVAEVLRFGEARKDCVDRRTQESSERLAAKF